MHQHRPDLLVQLVANELPRSVQPGFDGLRLDAEKFARFLDTHPFNHARDEHQSKDFRQIVGRLFDKLKDLPPADTAGAACFSLCWAMKRPFLLLRWFYYRTGSR